MTSLTDGLEKAHASGDGDVETGHLAEHRDTQEEVAGLGGQVTDAVAFGAEYDGQRAVQFGGVKRLAGLVVRGARQPDARVLKLHQRVAHTDGAPRKHRWHRYSRPSVGA